MKVAAKVIGMGNEVEHEPLEVEEGRAYVLLEMKVEDARKLAPGLGRTVGFQVILNPEE